MRPVRPVHLNDTGAKVRDLHHCLLFLLANQAPNDLKIILKRLAPEVRAATFGPATADLVFIFQDQITHTIRIPPNVRTRVVTNRDVDRATADALNWLLRDLGVL